MRKTFTLSFLGLVISGLLLGACSQMASYENEDLQLEQAKVDKDGGFVLTPLGGGNENAMLADCGDNCITERVLMEANTTTQIGNSNNFKDINYQIWNTPEQLIVQTTSNRTTDEIQIVVNGQTIINTLTEPEPAGNFVFTYFDLPEGYVACEYTLESVLHIGGGPQVTLSDIGYGVYEYCTDCEIVEKSGYVGNLEGENSGSPGNGFNNAWWYAFDIDGDATQDVYENENLIGSATYDEIEGTITINLDSDYSLSDSEDESVKWYSYPDGELPTAGRPIPGQAPNKGTSLVINTNDDRYYVIHLDVQTCETED